MITLPTPQQAGRKPADATGKTNGRSSPFLYERTVTGLKRRAEGLAGRALAGSISWSNAGTIRRAKALDITKEG
jgi:hypothetical protein